MKKIRNEGYQLYIVSPAERKMGQLTHIINTDGVISVSVNPVRLKNNPIGLDKETIRRLFEIIK